MASGGAHAVSIYQADIIRGITLGALSQILCAASPLQRPSCERACSVPPPEHPTPAPVTRMAQNLYLSKGDPGETNRVRMVQGIHPSPRLPRGPSGGSSCTSPRASGDCLADIAGER
jgi:hypothetical protein